MYCIGDIIAQSLEKNINSSDSNSKSNENSTNNSTPNENENENNTTKLTTTVSSNKTTTTPSITTHSLHHDHVGSSSSSCSNDNAITQPTGWIDVRRAGIFLVFGTLVSGDGLIDGLLDRQMVRWTLTNIYHHHTRHYLHHYTHTTHTHYDHFMHRTPLPLLVQLS